MTTLTLPSGQTATLRDPKTVSERLRRPIANANIEWAATNTFKRMVERARLPKVAKAKADEADPIPLVGEDLILVDRLNDLTAVALVESWSYEFPVTLETLQDITGPDYDALRAASKPFFNELILNVQPTSDPDSPTEPSNA